MHGVFTLIRKSHYGKTKEKYSFVSEACQLKRLRDCLSSRKLVYFRRELYIFELLDLKVVAQIATDRVSNKRALEKRNRPFETVSNPAFVFLGSD